MVHLTLMVALGVFTCLDVLITVIGMRVGCIELNPVVTTLGVQFWIVFRMLLLGGILTLFLTCYRLCLKYFRKGLWILRTTLFVLNFYIGAVVFSGFLAVYSKLLL